MPSSTSPSISPSVSPSPPPPNEEIFQYLMGLTDDGNSISCAVESNDGSLGVAFESIVYPVEVMLNIPEGHDIQVFIGLDGHSLISIGTAKKGLNRIPIDIDPKGDQIARCRLMKIALKEFSKSKVTIANAAIRYYLSSEVEEQRD